LVSLSVFLTTVALAENNQKQDFPWMNKNLSPDERAELVLKQMTLDEKIELLHGNGMAHSEQWQMPLTYLANGGAGYVVGVKRLGIPPIWMSRCLRRADERCQRALFDGAALEPGFSRELGPAGRLRIWRAHWP
jgi:hypothetical protein